MRRIAVLHGAIALILVALAACGGSDVPTGPGGEPVPTGIALSPAAVALTAVGDTLRVSATVLDQTGAPMDEPVVWSSDDVGVATVDGDGLVTAVGFGNATLRASAGTATRTAVIVVQDAIAAPSFAATVNPLFVANGCTASNCHGGGAGGLTLSSTASASYGAMVAVPSSDNPSILLVAPGNAAASYLVQKLDGTAPGSRMPIGGAPLTASEMTIIRNWINAGAPNN